MGGIRKKVRILLEMSENCLGIPLSDGSIALIDAEDRHLVDKWNWSGHKIGGIIYACRHDKTRTLHLHSVISGFSRTDHKNRNTLDNRKQNLRPASPKENSRNRGLFSNNTSGFKGVSFEKAINKWTATINVIGKNKRLGSFKSPVLAALVYDDQARKHFGEFAFLNFPDSGGESHGATP